MKGLALDIGFAIEIIDGGATEVSNLVQQVSKAADTIFLLNEDRVPHITLFQGRIPYSMQEWMTVAIEKHLLKKQKPLAMSTKLTVYGNGNIFWNVRNVGDLQDFHELSCRHLKPCAKGLMMSVHEETMRRRSTPTLERDIILKYGFPLAGDQYLPHVTLGRLVDIADKVKVEDIFTNEFVYTPRSLVMGRLGVYGDIVEVLNRYYL